MNQFAFGQRQLTPESSSAQVGRKEGRPPRKSDYHGYGGPPKELGHRWLLK